MSQFWTDEGADGAKLLTWENFFLNADTNAPVSAQIRLYPNGDFAVRSNEVETAYARVCPQDWDGDGRANEIDPDPFVCDGDWFGVANAIPAGGNTNAYYWLDISVTGRLDCAACIAIPLSVNPSNKSETASGSPAATPSGLARRSSR